MDEKQKLELELRALRLKKVNLEKEIKSLFDGKIFIQKDINNFMVQKRRAIEDHKEAVERLSKMQNQIRDAQKEYDTIKLNCAKEQAVIGQETLRLEGEKKDLDTKTVQLTKDTLKNKEDRKENSAKLAMLDQREASLRDEFKKINKAWKDIEEANKTLKAEKDTLEIKKVDIDTNLEKSKRLLNESNAKLNKVSDDLRMTEARKEQITAEEKRIAAKEKEQADVVHENSRVAESLIVKEKALNRGFANLETAKQEIEIKRLRVEKLIKDKGMAEELRKLEEELRK